MRRHNALELLVGADCKSLNKFDRNWQRAGTAFKGRRGSSTCPTERDPVTGKRSLPRAERKGPKSVAQVSSHNLNSPNFRDIPVVCNEGGVVSSHVVVRMLIRRLSKSGHRLAQGLPAGLRNMVRNLLVMRHGGPKP